MSGDHRIPASAVYTLINALTVYRTTRAIPDAEHFLWTVDLVIDAIDFNNAYGPADRLSLAAMNGAIGAASSDRVRESLTVVRDAAVVGWADAIATEYEVATKKGEP